MSSKGRFVATQSLAEKIYWHRTLVREQEKSPWWPNRPTPEQQAESVDRAWRKAEAIAARYRRMKARARRLETQAEQGRAS